MTSADNSSSTGSARSSSGWGVVAPFLRPRMAVAAAAVLGCLVVLFLVATNYEVVDQRPVCPTCTDQLYDVRMFDAFNLSVKPDYKPTPDAVSGYFLVAVSSMALLALVFLHVVAPTAPSRIRWFFGSTWLGGLYLAADELFGVHESIGYNMRFLGDIPGVERPDDVVFALYVVPLLAYLVVFRRYLFSSRPILAAYALGLGFFGLALISDVLSLGPVEDLFEVVSALWVVVAFALVTVERMILTQVDAVRAGAAQPTVSAPGRAVSPGEGAHAPATAR